MRLGDTFERRTRFRFLQSLLFGASYILLVTVLTAPLTVDSESFREHRSVGWAALRVLRS